MQRTVIALMGLWLACLPVDGALAASRHGWALASTIGEYALATVALGVPAATGDWQGAAMAGGSLLIGGGSAYGLKALIHERRPDGRGNDSFPSAHSAIAFAAAATLENRHGWKAGLPALALAGFVGIARIEAKRHHWHDVAAGAGIGSLSAVLLTSRRDDRVRLTPWAASGGGGMVLAARF